MYQSALVRHAEIHPYRPGQEDWTLCVLSSAHADAGIPAVILEPQGDPALCGLQSAGVWAWLAALPLRLIGKRRIRHTTPRQETAVRA